MVKIGPPSIKSLKFSRITLARASRSLAQKTGREPATVENPLRKDLNVYRRGLSTPSLANRLWVKNLRSSKHNVI